MTAKKTYKLDLSATLQALDRKDFGFYLRLSEEEKKAYAPLVLMRYMSLLTDQSTMAAYAVIATNDLVNIGFWDLRNHPELQHRLLCLTGLGSKQYRPWLSAKRKKKSNKIDDWLLERFPEMNEDELSLFKSGYNTKTWTAFVKASGVDDEEAKALIDAWKKNEA